MTFKKAGSKIYGVDFNKKEQEAINAEIQLQCADYDRKNVLEIDAIILWLLHENFGFGMKRLRRFFDLFATEIAALCNRYEMEKKDSVWLCTYKLKEYGLDIEQWNKEDENNGSQKRQG